MQVCILFHLIQIISIEIEINSLMNEILGVFGKGMCLADV